MSTKAVPVPSSTRSAGEPQPGRHVVMAVVAIALLMASVDQTIVSTALPVLQHDLGASVNWSTWTITIYALGQIVALPLAGRLSDQFGRKGVFLGAVAVFTLASLACALATNIYLLVALRAVQALGGGAFLPSATGIVSDQYGRNRDRAIGLFTSIFPIGGLIGPVLGGLFVTYWTWQGIFLVNVPLGMLLLVCGLKVLPRSPKHEHSRTDVLGIVLLVIGLVAVMFGITQLGSNGVTLLGFGLPLVVGIGALTLFLRHSAAVDEPFLPIRLLRRKDFAVVNSINVLSGAATLGFAALIPLYAVDRYGLSTLSAGTLLSARAVGSIAVAGIAAFAIRRTGYRWPMRVGFLLAGVGLIMIAATPLWSFTPEVWLAVGAAVAGIGMGISIPSNNNAGLDLEPESAAAISGLRGMARQIGGMIGISVISAVSAGSSNPGHAQAIAFLVLGVILLVLVPVVRLVPERKGGW